LIVCSLKSGSLDSAKTPVEPLTFSKAGLFEETYSPLPPSPFNTDPSNNDDVDGGKDSSISSIQTASSDYDNRVSLPKVDDSKLGSDSSDQSSVQPSLSPRSDISSVSNVSSDPHQHQTLIEEPRKDLNIAANTKSDVADPKLAPHNVWLKEDSSLLSDPYEDSESRYESDRQWQRQQVFFIL